MNPTRRLFLKSTFMSGMAAAVSAHPLAAIASENANKPCCATGCCKDGICPNCKRQVCITHGDDRTENILSALKPFAQQVKAQIGNRKVVIKPNNVSTTRQLAATHVDSLRGIIEFMKSIGIRKDDMVIAESAASGPTMEGFENYGYTKLKDKYGIDLVDLDKEPIQKRHILNDGDFHPRFVRFSKLLLDPETFVVSAAVMKTHDRVVATLSLKNIIFGAPIKDEGFAWGNRGKKGAINDKPIAHGGGPKGINYNIFQLSYVLHPDLAVIDGFQGMEGNGPVGGDPVDHRIALASMDWYSVDRTAIELMGIPFENVGYLNYLAQAGVGVADLAQIKQLGESIDAHKRSYKMNKNFDHQMTWKA